MTKVFSLSKKAYQTLKDLKKPKRILLRRSLKNLKHQTKKSVLQFAGTWKGNDIDEIYTQIQNTREKTTSREIKI
jgi:hypothetical protein